MAVPVLYLEPSVKEALNAGFAAAFGGEPTRYFSAPGRTEIGGNHTDHQRGRVHGGGFTGTVQAFVPFEILEDFRAGIGQRRLSCAEHPSSGRCAGCSC